MVHPPVQPGIAGVGRGPRDEHDVAAASPAAGPGRPPRPRVNATPTESAAIESLRPAVLLALSRALAEPVVALRDRPLLAAHAWDDSASLEALVQIESRLGVFLDLPRYHAARHVDDLVGLAVAARGIPSHQVRP